MTVGYDVTSLAEYPFGGIATVCRQTLLHAAVCGKITPTALYRRGSPINLEKTGVAFRSVSWRDRFRFTRYDVVHALCHRIPPVRRGRLVYTLHDAWSLYPNRYQSPRFQRRIGRRMTSELRRADAVVCDSQTTLANLQQLQIVDPALCHVVYPGTVASLVSPSAPPPEALERLLSTDFVLFVGRLEVRKNLEHIVEAMLPLKSVNLVIVGEHGYGGQAIVGRVLSRMPVDRLYLLSRVSDTDLDFLYFWALASLQPSWEEGFGMPMLEAMAHGCPLITSNCSASAEIAGDAATLVDPAHPEQSTAAIQELLEDRSTRQKRSESGRIRSRLFTWEAYFQGLRGIYQSLQ